ncbi:hypothetical protein ABBQ38_014376 [Trebouxia sp. C0009 RCD-2024]
MQYNGRNTGSPAVSSLLELFKVVGRQLPTGAGGGGHPAQAGRLLTAVSGQHPGGCGAGLSHTVQIHDEDTLDKPEALVGVLHKVDAASQQRNPDVVKLVKNLRSQVLEELSSSRSMARARASQSVDLVVAIAEGSVTAQSSHADTHAGAGPSSHHVDLVGAEGPVIGQPGSPAGAGPSRQPADEGPVSQPVDPAAGGGTRP